MRKDWDGMKTLLAAENQIKSKRRVIDHGEVFTAPREVRAMLNLVRSETNRIASRFLDPACGTGNFLTEVLARKLKVVQRRYKKNQLNFEWHSFIAVSNIYGIDLLPDNVSTCRERLFNIFDTVYSLLFPGDTSNDYRAAIKHVISANVVCGDTLALTTTETPPMPIVFSEWKTMPGHKIKRHDFVFSELLEHRKIAGTPLFSGNGGNNSEPLPAEEYAPVEFMKVAHAKPE